MTARPHSPWGLVILGMPGSSPQSSGLGRHWVTGRPPQPLGPGPRQVIDISTHRVATLPPKNNFVGFITLDFSLHFSFSDSASHSSHYVVEGKFINVEATI